MFFYDGRSRELRQGTGMKQFVKIIKDCRYLLVWLPVFLLKECEMKLKSAMCLFYLSNKSRKIYLATVLNQRLYLKTQFKKVLNASLKQMFPCFIFQHFFIFLIK